MDEEDFSWVRRSRFSHSVVRSNSGREQFGAFMEQFNRGAALRQEAAGSDSRFRLHPSGWSYFFHKRLGWREEHTMISLRIKI